VEVCIWSVNVGWAVVDSAVKQAGCLHRGCQCTTCYGPQPTEHGNSIFVHCVVVVVIVVVSALVRRLLNIVTLSLCALLSCLCVSLPVLVYDIIVLSVERVV